MTIKTRMKKMFIMFWALMCLLFLEGCATRQANCSSADSSGIEESGVGDKMEQQSEMQQNTEPEAPNDQVFRSVPKTQVLELGNMEHLGLGFMVCTMPDKEDEDYKLCFFGTESDSEDMFKPFSEIDFDLGAADYIFPDVREGNASIGRFLDIYYFDMTEVQGMDKRDWVIIARYDVDGKINYDTRAYTVSENSYCVDEKLMQEFNEKYSDAEEYPMTELFVMPHD